MFAEGRVYDTAVEEDFGGVGNVTEGAQGLVEFAVVVVGKGLDPGFDFLWHKRLASKSCQDAVVAFRGSRTCLSDIDYREIRGLRRRALGSATLVGSRPERGGSRWHSQGPVGQNCR